MENIVNILKQVRPEYEFSGVDDLFAGGMLDSFDLVRLVSLLEERFKLSIGGEDITPENFRNVEAIANLMSKYGATLE